ncbi:MAG: hypothetical protein GY811_14210 [Myxococcales bacterium]|nr:hypothetical protein [Myxococcales bacterium]
MLKLSPFAAFAAALSIAAACGLIDPDIADFDLSLPEKEIIVDTSTWELTDDALMPAIDCSENAGVCSLGISALCGADGVCFGSCSDADTCDVKVQVNLWHSFDLASEKPELQEIEGKPLVSISISRIAYKVTENTMNVDTPEMTVYVASEGIMSPGDPGAQAVGTLSSVPAGTTIEGQDVELTPDGRELLAEYMKKYSQPFNIIVGTNVDIEAGDEVPKGMLTAVLMVTAVAGI